MVAVVEIVLVVVLVASRFVLMVQGIYLCCGGNLGIGGGNLFYLGPPLLKSTLLGWGLDFMPCPYSPQL